MPDSRLSSRSFAVMLGQWRGAGPAYRDLADAVRVLSLDGRIVPGTALPAERDLAARLELSRTTVAAAYRDLRESGHLRSLRGSGSVVQAVGRMAAAPEPGGADTIDLSQASPSAWPGLPELFAEAASQATRWVGRPGYDVRGDPELREAIAERYTARGLPTDATQIIVTTGAQAAISLLADVLVRPGDRVAIETPTYPHAADAFSRAGGRLTAIPVHLDSGWDLERAEHVLRRAAPSVVYTMPDFQNPTGASMSQAAREEFVGLAADAGAVLVADETTADLRIDPGGASAPLGAGMDPLLQRRVVTLGSLGKSVWGGLRVGWIRADVDLVQRLVSARPRRELGTPEMEQQVALLALARMPEILEQRARLLGAGRDALCAALASRLPHWQVPCPPGGVALWVGLGEPVSSPLSWEARTRGLVISSGPRFGVDGGHERHLRIPFTAAPAILERSVEILAEAWDSALSRARAGQPDEPLLASVV